MNEIDRPPEEQLTGCRGFVTAVLVMAFVVGFLWLWSWLL